MKLRKLKHMFLRLSPEEKMAGAGGLLVILSTFMPWFSIDSNVIGEGITESGFSGHFGVMGFVIFLITALGLANLTSSISKFKLPTFGYKKEQLQLFLTGQAAFLLLLTMAVYTKRSLDFTNSEIRFGLYGALAGAILATFASYALFQKTEKKEAEAFFDHNDEESYQEPAEEIVNETDTEEPAPHKGFYYQESKETTNPISAQAELGEEEAVVESTIQNELNEELTEAELVEDKLEGSDDETLVNQGSYFIKEAGLEAKSNIKVDTDTIKPVHEKILKHEPVEKEAKKEEVSSSDDFYSDL